MSDDFDLEGWEPQAAAPNLDGWKKHAFRPDKRAEERLALAMRPRIRSFECPGCGILKNVEPTFATDEWHYVAQCSHCGTSWANARYLLRKCEACGKKVPMTSRNPQGLCNCTGEIERPFTGKRQ
jgi:hypothetical protein